MTAEPNNLYAALREWYTPGTFTETKARDLVELLRERNAILSRQVEELRKGLRFYADEDAWRTDDAKEWSAARLDKGSIARAVLSSTKPETE